MSDLPSISGKAAIAAFEKAGFSVARISKSSHHILKKPGHRFLLTVPVHGNKTLKTGALRSLIRDSGLTIDEFNSILQGGEPPKSASEGDEHAGA